MPDRSETRASRIAEAISRRLDWLFGMPEPWDVLAAIVGPIIGLSLLFAWLGAPAIVAILVAVVAVSGFWIFLSYQSHIRTHDRSKP